MVSMFARRLQVGTLSIKREPAPVDGQFGDAVIVIPSAPHGPLDPVDAETKERLHIESPHRVFKTMVEGDYDIRNGDIAVIDSKEWPVKYVEPWEGLADYAKTLWLFIEESLS